MSRAQRPPRDTSGNGAPPPPAEVSVTAADASGVGGGEVGVLWSDSQGTRWLYRAQPTQARLHRSAAPNVLYGGAAGGGKSHALRWHAIMACLARPGVEALLLRRQYTELETTHLLRLAEEVPPSLATFDRSRHRLVFPGGSVLQFGHCHTDAEVATYLSTEWAMLLVDEASQFTPYQLSMLASRVRSTDPGVSPQYVLASNPGGDGHLWLKQRFVDRAVPGDPHYDPREWEFIPARLGDNRYLPESYRRRLEGLPAPERRAYLDGDWDVFAGQVFSEWDPSAHVVDPFPLPEHWVIEAGMDWGYDPAPAVVEWVAYGEDGAAWVYRELVAERLSPFELGRQIALRCVTYAERRMIIHADPSMWSRSPVSGVSIAEEVERGLAGTMVALVRANSDRIHGWTRLHSWLRGEGSGPRLRVFRPDPASGLGCPYLIETLPSLTFTRRADGDVEKCSTDHAADALRYAMVAHEPRARLPEECAQPVCYEERLAALRRRLLRRAGRPASALVSDAFG